MPKTFKSAITVHPRRLHLEKNEHGVNIHVSDPEWRDVYGITIAPSDAPALALAILEAAGWPNEHLATTEILRRLRELDEHVKAVEAEARERAELEAEALELFNTFWRSDGEGPSSIENWRVPNEEREDWLAVARRARELAKEATK